MALKLVLGGILDEHGAGGRGTRDEQGAGGRGTRDEGKSSEKDEANEKEENDEDDPHFIWFGGSYPSRTMSKGEGGGEEKPEEEEELEEEKDDDVEDETILDTNFGVLTDKKVDGLFKGKKIGSDLSRTTIHVVVFDDDENTRKIYVDRKQGDSYTVQSRLIQHDVRGKKHMWRKFTGKDMLQDAKKFARDPREEQTRQKEAAEQTKARKKEARVAVNGPNPSRTFWDNNYSKVYAMVHNNPSRVAEAFERLPCDARHEVDDRTSSYATLTFKVVFMERGMKDFFRRCNRAHRQFWNTLLAIFKENEEMFVDHKWGEVPVDGKPQSFEQYLYGEVYGFSEGGITRGVKNCAENIPSRGRTLEQVRREVRECWDSVPKAVFWSALNQWKSAFESNFAKIAIAKKKGLSTKGFTVNFRKCGKKPEVIDLPGSGFINFRAETDDSIKNTTQERKNKKIKNAAERKERAKKRAAEKKKFLEETVKSPDNRSNWVCYRNEWYKHLGHRVEYGGKQVEVLKNNVRTTSHGKKLEKRLQRLSASADAPPAPVAAPAPVAVPTSSTPTPTAPAAAERGEKKKKTLIIAKFGAKVIGAKKKETKLCGSAKSCNEILADEGKNIFHKRLRYNAKTGEAFVDVVVKREKTSSEANKDNKDAVVEKAAEKARGGSTVAAIDLGINPFFVAVNTGGEILHSDKAWRIKLLELRKKIDALQSKIAKRDHTTSLENGSKRTPTQYRKTTRKLQKKLAKMRERLKRVRKDYHYCEAKRIFKFCDTIVVNNLKVQQIAHESKKDGSLSKHARKNMLTLSPGYFVEVIKHVARRTPGKKVIFGCGEQWTSRTCTRCGKVNNELSLSKSFDCRECKFRIDRDVNGALNNLKEVLHKLFKPNGEFKDIPLRESKKPRRRKYQRKEQQQQEEEEEEENVNVLEEGDVENNNIDQ